METQLSICKTQRKSSKTQLYICETQHKIFRYLMQDVNTIQIINPPLLNRWHALHFPAILVRHFAWKKCFVLAVEPVWKLFQKAESDSSVRETDKGAAKYSSFKNYAAQESEVRSTHFRSSGSKRKWRRKKRPRCDNSDPWQDILYTWPSTPISAKVSIRLIKKLTYLILLLTCSLRIIDHLSFKSELDVKHPPHFNL